MQKPAGGLHSLTVSNDGRRAYYAIIKDRLIYAVDLRNGLYVLRYSGAFEDEVRGIDFLDGNSNQGDALCFEPVGRKPRSCG